VRLWKYTVTGRGAFPIDMLRFDQAWPHTTTDAYNVGSHLIGDINGRRSVTLLSIQYPTADRWASFDWGLIEDPCNVS